MDDNRASFLSLELGAGSDGNSAVGSKRASAPEILARGRTGAMAFHVEAGGGLLWVAKGRRPCL